jgi:hypothetical protein
MLWQMLLVCVALGASGCFFGDPDDSATAGVRGGGADLEVRVVLCSSDLVRSVRLERASGEPGVYGTTIWEIEAPAGSDRQAFVIGETPSGFDELIAIQADLDPNETYVVSATRLDEDEQVRTAFVPSELSTTDWSISANRLLSDARLTEMVVEDCG